MYIPKLKVAVLQIPKCGSQSLRDAIEAEHGKCPLAGHLTQAQVENSADKHGYRLDAIYALIRDPWERFISGMNFVYGDREATIHEAIEQYLGGNLHRSGNVVTKPQIDFLGGEMDVELRPFEGLGDLLAELGCSHVPHKNKSRPRWTRWSFRSWDDEISARLAVDDEVRSKALGA